MRSSDFCMKALVIVIFFLGSITIVFAQSPVQWNCISKKIAEKAYELHITATMDAGWHIYSQTQPEDAMVFPSKIQFVINPLVRLRGNPKEIGRMDVYENKELGIKAYQYATKVEFVQIIQLKANVKTNVNGTISFMACTNEQCLPATSVPFLIRLQ
jgi:hypothetical protein